MMDKLYNHTMALCPVCRDKVEARIIERGNRVYLEKFCPRDGLSYALICSDAEWYRGSTGYIKPGQEPLERTVKEFQGCPQSCGLCPEHQQHTCLPVIEITSRCDLKCPICLKRFPEDFDMDVKGIETALNRLLECEGEVHVINLSGGEPTLHPQLEGFINLAEQKGIMQTTVSTNGLRLLKDRQLRRLFKENGTIAALQFDGFEPETYIKLRGRDLAKTKLDIIEALEEEGIKYSLVATVSKGINDREIKPVVDFFFKSRAISLMFQPAAYTGAAEPLMVDDRLTTPDVVREIEKSSFVKKGDFNPLPCSHYSCFALAYYLKINDERYLSLKEFLGEDSYLNVIANRTLPGLDRSGYETIKGRIYEMWSAADTCSSDEHILQRLRGILKEINSQRFSPKGAFSLGAESMKAVFIHQFMDLHTFDFGRIVKCCNHYVLGDGRFIPMCAQNVFFQ